MGSTSHSNHKEPSTFIVGLDGAGHWVAIETHGRGGGIFTDRKTALRYAEFETGHRPEAVRFSPTPLHLNL